MDWNRKVGSSEIPGVTGKFGLGVQNEAGQRLTRVLPREHTGHSEHHLPTTPELTLQRYQYRNQIIFFAVEYGEAHSTQSAEIRPGADCASDHELLIANFRLS